MTAPSAPKPSTGTPPTALILTSELEETLRSFIEIVNEVIPFHHYRVYLRPPGNQDGIWKFEHGLINGDSWKGPMQLYRSIYDDHSLSSDPTVHGVDPKGRFYASALLVISPAVRGCLVLLRDKTSRPFTESERFQLCLGVKLLHSVVVGSYGGKLLRSLHLRFLELRAFTRATLDAKIDDPLQHQPYGQAKQILREYLARSMLLCFPTWFDPQLCAAPPKPAPVVRVAAKLVTPDGKALWIPVFDSKPAVDWNEAQQQRRFNLSDSDSISARAFSTGQPYTTNTFDTDKTPAFKLFPDTKSFLLAPIVAANLDCLGVLSIETPLNNGFDETLEAAFALLAAHAAWPLREALLHEQLTRNKQGELVVDEFRYKFQQAHNWKSIRGNLQEALRRLGYSRGLVCKVEHALSRVKSRFYWGDHDMAAVRRVTCRPFAQYPKDCQILAVEERKPVIIDDPRSDERVDQEARDLGNLHPFGIFPLVDAHGVVRLTIHLERQDTAPFKDVDRKLVEKLCAAAMDSWQHVRSRQLELRWVETILQHNLQNEGQLLERFLDFLTTNGVSRRARLFRVSPDQPQAGYQQSGPDQAADFGDFILKDQSDESKRHSADLQKFRPLVVVRSDVPHSSEYRGEFPVFADPYATYKEYFKKEGLTEWVEAGIRLSNTLQYKLVLDQKGLPNDGFALSDLRLIERLVHTVSLELTRIDNEKLRSELCIAGAIEGLKRHELTNQLEDISAALSEHAQRIIESGIQSIVQRARTVPADQLGAEFKQQAESYLQPWLRQVKDSMHDLDRKLEERLTPLRLRDEVDLALEIVDHMRAGVPIQPLFNGPDRPLPGQGHSLCLILLILLHNAIESTLLRRTSSEAAPTLDEAIVLRVDASGGIIEVEDHGVGISEEVYTSFALRPRLATRVAGHGRGLAYARLLADELDWMLAPRPVASGAGTIFALSTSAG